MTANYLKNFDINDFDFVWLVTVEHTESMTAVFDDIDEARKHVIKFDEHPQRNPNTGESIYAPVFKYDYAIREDSARYEGQRHISETWGSLHNWRITRILTPRKK